MIIERINEDDAKKKIDDYTFVIGSMISEMIVGQASQYADIDWEEILDVRFISEDKEMHVFRGDIEEGLTTIIFEDEQYDDCNTRMTYLDKTFGNCMEFNKVRIKEYYDYDEDGQLIIKHIRPVELI